MMANRNNQALSSIINIFVSLLLRVGFSTAQQIRVYPLIGHKGPSEEVSIAQCTNIPVEIAGRVASINTQNRCARLYNETNCNGNFIEVMARSPSHNNLNDWDFNNKAMSVGPCPDACDAAVTGRVPEPGEKVNLVIYSRKDFKGAYEEMNVKDCTLIPAKFIHPGVLSVEVFDQCIQFYNNPYCRHTGEHVDTIEFRPGTPFHNDISTWHFPRPQSASHCSMKCNRTATTAQVSNPNITAVKSNEVILFDTKNYAGNWTRIIVDACLDILNEWEGAAVAVKTFNQSCITLYDRRGCKGNYLTVVGSKPDLSHEAFDALTRSIKPCEIPGNPIRIISNGNVPPSSHSSTKETLTTTTTTISVSPMVPLTIVVLLILGLGGVAYMYRMTIRKRLISRRTRRNEDEFIFEHIS